MVHPNNSLVVQANTRGLKIPKAGLLICPEGTVLILFKYLFILSKHIYIWQVSPLLCKTNPPVKYEHIDELVQERRNSIANALELHLSCTNP